MSGIGGSRGGASVAGEGGGGGTGAFGLGFGFGLGLGVGFALGFDFGAGLGAVFFAAFFTAFGGAFFATFFAAGFAAFFAAFFTAFFAAFFAGFFLVAILRFPRVLSIPRRVTQSYTEFCELPIGIFVHRHDIRCTTVMMSPVPVSIGHGRMREHHSGQSATCPIPPALQWPFDMQVLQAGQHKLIYLELQPELVTNIARQAGFEARIKDGQRSIQLDLRTPGGDGPILLFDAADPANLGWFSRCQFYVDGRTGAVMQTPIALANKRDRSGKPHRNAVRLGITKELPASFRLPGNQPLTEQVFYHLLLNFLTALIKTGVAVCGGGVVIPLAGRTETVGSRN